MQSIVHIIILTLLWVVNLFNGTGLDAVYHVTDLTKLIVLILTAFCVSDSFRKKGDIRITNSDFQIFGGMVLVFFLSSYIQGFKLQTFDYLWVFCIIYLVSKLKIDTTVLFWTGLIYGFLGAVILYIYNFGSLLSGWNENYIAMLGMHSFLILVIPFFNRNSDRSKAMLLIATAIFSYLIWPTDSRSGILFLIVAALFALNIIPRDIAIGGKGRLLFFLLIPLIVAVICSTISGTTFFNSLESWSIRTFNKPIFNGRDQLWIYGFEMLFENLFFGCGTLITHNWHNSAIHCLTAYGIIGYSFWIAGFRKLLYSVKEWFGDPYICGCYISFIVLWLQQSVELGFISDSPSLLPYIILGLMFGRANFLKNEQTPLQPKGENHA